MERRDPDLRYAFALGLTFMTAGHHDGEELNVEKETKQLLAE
jgi:hypothetical protein